MSNRPKGRWVRRLWLCLGLLLIASLCWRESRELQVSIFWALLHIPGQHTFAQGQPPGCVLHIIPNVQFTEAYKQECRRRAAESPDHYLLARYCHGGPVKTFPPASAWRGHPLLQWAAQDIAGQLITPDWSAETQPATAPRDKLDRALEIVRLAQERSPENGALWLAETLLLFERGEDTQALQALRTAGDKPSWDPQEPEHLFYARDLLAREGFTRFNASVEVHNRLIFSQLWMLQFGTMNHLERLVASAAQNKRDPEFTALIDVWARLRHARCLTPNGPFCFPSIYQNSDDLLPAIARNLGLEMSSFKIEGPWSKEAYEAAEKRRKEALSKYVRLHVPPALAEEILAETPPDLAHLKAAGEALRKRRDAVFAAALWSGPPSGASLLAMAVFLACVIIALTFRLVPKDCIGMPRSRRFWLALVVASIAAGMLLFSAFFGICQPVGLRTTNSPVHPLRDAIGCSATLIVVFLAPLFLLKPLHWRRLAHVAVIASYLAYLILVTITAVQRHRAIDAIAALYTAM